MVAWFEERTPGGVEIPPAPTSRAQRAALREGGTLRGRGPHDLEERCHPYVRVSLCLHSIPVSVFSLSLSVSASPDRMSVKDTISVARNG